MSQSRFNTLVVIEAKMRNKNAERVRHLSAALADIQKQNARGMPFNTSSAKPIGETHANFLRVKLHARVNGNVSFMRTQTRSVTCVAWPMCAHPNLALRDRASQANPLANRSAAPTPGFRAVRWR